MSMEIKEKPITIDTSTTRLSGSPSDFAVIKVVRETSDYEAYLYVEMRTGEWDSPPFRGIFQGQEGLEVLRQFQRQGIGTRLDASPLEVDDTHEG